MRIDPSVAPAAFRKPTATFDQTPQDFGAYLEDRMASASDQASAFGAPGFFGAAADVTSLSFADRSFPPPGSPLNEVPAQSKGPASDTVPSSRPPGVSDHAGLEPPTAYSTASVVRQPTPRPSAIEQAAFRTPVQASIPISDAKVAAPQPAQVTQARPPVADTSNGNGAAPEREAPSVQESRIADSIPLLSAQATAPGDQPVNIAAATPVVHPVEPVELAAGDEVDSLPADATGLGREASPAFNPGTPAASNQSELPAASGTSESRSAQPQRTAQPVRSQAAEAGSAETPVGILLSEDGAVIEIVAASLPLDPAAQAQLRDLARDILVEHGKVLGSLSLNGEILNVASTGGLDGGRSR